MQFQDSTSMINFLASTFKFLPVDVCSVAVESIDFEDSMTKQCYNNSFKYILRQCDDTKYVLGYVLVHGVPIEHAWVKSGNDYFDITLPDGRSSEYFKVCEISKDLLNEFVFKNHHAPDMNDLNRFIHKAGLALT